jgi:hypothetical protein
MKIIKKEINLFDCSYTIEDQNKTYNVIKTYDSTFPLVKKLEKISVTDNNILIQDKNIINKIDQFILENMKNDEEYKSILIMRMTLTAKNNIRNF